MAKNSRELIYRILDANLNRASEGLRVCEEVLRFVLNNRRLTEELRNIRHRISGLLTTPERERMIRKRNSQRDVGRNFVGVELKRSSYQDIFLANLQRVKESIRVLEEFYKLVDVKIATKFKRIRYRIYDFEKEVTSRLASLSVIRQRFNSSR